MLSDLKYSRPNNLEMQRVTIAHQLPPMACNVRDALVVTKDSQDRLYVNPGVCSESKSVSFAHVGFSTHEAKTTSLPHGEIDAEPTGLSRRKEPFSPKVGLSNAVSKFFDSFGSVILS